MIAHPHTLQGPCQGARTFGLSVRSCVRCGALLSKNQPSEPKCLCPDDCNCRSPWRMNYCGCKAH